MRNEKLIIAFSKMDPNVFSAFLAWFAADAESTFEEIFRLGETCKTAYHCVRSLKFPFLDFLDLPVTAVKPILDAFKYPQEIRLSPSHYHEIISALPSVKNVTVRWVKGEGPRLRCSMKELVEKFPQATHVTVQGFLGDWCLSSVLKALTVYYIENSTVVNLPVLMPNLKKLYLCSTTKDCNADVVLNEDMKSLFLGGDLVPIIRGNRIRNLVIRLLTSHIDVQCTIIEKFTVMGYEINGHVRADHIDQIDVRRNVSQISLRIDASVCSVWIWDCATPREVILDPHKLLLEDEVITIPFFSVDNLVFSPNNLKLDGTVLTMSHKHGNYKKVLFRFSVKRVYICACEQSHNFKIDAEEIHFSACPDCEKVDWLTITEIHAVGDPRRDEEKYLLLKAYVSAAGLSEEKALREMGLQLIAVRMTGKETPVFQH